MQKDDHLLDQYLKNKVDEADFDFKEEYWLKASQMLDEEDEKKKKRPFFWRWFTTLCVLLAVGVGTFIFSNKNNQTKTDNKLSVKQTGQVEKSTGDMTPGGIPAEKSYVTDKPVNAAIVNAPAEASANNNRANEINKPSDNNVNPVVNNVAAVTDPISEKGPKEKAPVQAGPENNRHGRKVPVVGVQVSLNEKSKPGKQDRQPRGKNRKEKQPLAKATKVNDESGKTTGLPAKKKVESNNTVVLNNKRVQPIDTQIFLQRQPRDESVYNPRYNASLKDYVSERLDSITIFSFKPAPVVKAEAAPPEIKKDTPVKKKNALQFFIAGGASFNKGFTGNANTSVSWGMAPYLNLGAEKDINDKISIASQIGFTYFNALNVQKKVMHYKYSFGYDSTTLSVEYRRMYQLMLPLTVAYHLNKYHNVWASIGATYVLNTSSKVTDNGKSNYQTGYQDGINPFDLFGQLGYQYALSRRFAFQLFLQQGFMSATKSDYFNISKPNTQTRVSIGLKYYFKRNGN